MQSSGIPKMRHYVGFWQIGSHIITNLIIIMRALSIGVARGRHGRAFALPSLNFVLPSKSSSYLNINCT